MPEVTLSRGVIRYTDSGAGQPVLFVHGLLVDGGLWRDVVPSLAGSMRCIVPDLPMGAHRTAMNPDADLSPTGIADLIAEFIDALGLAEATVVANDTGGAVAQMLTARHPEKVTRLLLTPCDTYDNFLPWMFRYLQLAARVPGLLYTVLLALKLRPLRRLPFAFGWLAKRGVPADLSDAWVDAVLGIPATRRDVVKLLRGIRGRDLVAAATELRSYQRPVLLAFAPEDRFFKLAHAERMVAELPNARLERIQDSYSFAPLDQPANVARLVTEFATA